MFVSEIKASSVLILAGKDTLSAEEKKVSTLKEQFNKFEDQLILFKKGIDLRSDVNNVQRTLEENDRWLEYGPHTESELKVCWFLCNMYIKPNISLQYVFIVLDGY